jgi:branched-chain amino acid transport system ATP-binding protein
MSRALTTDPALLLLDEISFGLAPMIVSNLFDVVARLAGEGIAIVIVEQFADLALSVADYAAVMSHGRIQVMGEPADVRGSLEVAYLGMAG